jgi:hypothetical protein
MAEWAGRSWVLPSNQRAVDDDFSLPISDQYDPGEKRPGSHSTSLAPCHMTHQGL